MSDPDQLAIDVRRLQKTYREGIFFRKQFSALRGVDLTVRRGEIFGLLGPNGAGKTTLIKILLGIIRASGGEAFLLGELAGSKAARRRIGYLPENLNFASHHTGVRALQLLGRLSNVDETTIRTRGAELLELVGLKGREGELVRKYSKGMRQRLGLAQAMLHDPDLMIMDEPTDGLDPVGRSQIRQLIVFLKQQGKTIFLNSHILQEVELVCDRVAILVRGTLRGIGTPHELTQQLQGALDARLKIEVCCTREQIERLSRESVIAAEPLPDERWSIVAHANSQADVDRLIDLARRLEISIVKLERTRPSLEEVFLSMVGQSEDAHPTAEPAVVAQVLS